MATNTIIQYLESAQTTGLGTSVPVGASAMHRSQTETFIAGGTVAVGDWVAFDTSKSGANKVLTVVQASNVALGNALVCGVVLGSADSSGLLTAGHKVKVCISGYVAAAKVNAGVVAAGTVVGLDTRYGIRRVINVNADYSAIEEYVMRKGSGLRVDYGETAHKLYTDAFSVMTFA